MGLFGKEKITLMLEKFDYKPGDVIRGTVTLNLKKPTKARKLEVGLIGRRISKQSNLGVGPMMASRGRGGVRSSTQYQTVYNFMIPLDMEKEYYTGDYKFEIKIPSTILQDSPTLDGTFGQAAAAVKMLAGVSSRIDWIVRAQLDVPMALDVKKSQKIIISE